MLVISIFKDACDAKQALTNIAIASYVTAYARLNFFSLVDKIETQRQFSVLYHDTDSVVYVRDYNDNKIETGDYLWELPEEFEGYNGAKCHKFASLGPKNYGYELLFPDGSTKANMKVRGLSLTENTIDIVNFTNMVQMAMANIDGDRISVTCPQQNIISNQHHTVLTKQFSKIYRPTSDKRRMVGEITLPCGYQIQE